MKQWLSAFTVCVVSAALAQGAETPEQMLKRAAQMAKDGRAARAVRVYQDFLKAHPTHSQVTEAHYRLAKCLDGIGWVDEAIEHLQQVVRSRRKIPQRLQAYHMLGKLQASLKQYAPAIKTFEAMLAEGAGLYEDEVMSLCAGYYALLKKYDDAAAKLNILMRKRGSRFAEQAAYKLVLLWLQAGKPDHTRDALQLLIQEFPKNKQIPALMVRAADLCRTQGRFARAVAICEQLKSHFAKTPEALAGGYVLGLCHRDRKEYEKAAGTFEAIARAPQHRRQGLAAEALLQAADIYHFEMANLPKAMGAYGEAAALARNSDSERKEKVLEQCYFRLAEYHYRKKNWSVALEYYLLLRRVGTQLNILGRIMRCQSELNLAQKPGAVTDSDVEAIKKKIAANPGSFAAAEGEVFLIDRKLPRHLRWHRGYEKYARQYAAVLKKYPRSVLSESHLESYIHSQIGFCYSTSKTPADLKKAIGAFEKSVEVDPKTPYLVGSLESVALLADQVGQKQKAFDAYQKLYQLSANQIRTAYSQETAPDPALKRRSIDYLKGMLTRADPGTSVEKAIALVERIKKEKGIFSEAAREAQYYLGELYFVKKDFSSAVKSFRLFIRLYGPKQDGKGEVADAPWKPRSVDDKTAQLYEAAVRAAHAWYLQGHTQNMLEAYRWIIRNFPHRNPYMAEANYWLAMELGKGKKGRTAEGQRAMAEELWRMVVNPSLKFAEAKFSEGFHFWVADRKGQYASVQRYVKSAILKCAKVFGSQGRHEMAARMLEQYLRLYPLTKDPRTRLIRRDEMYDVARYALGREYIALGEVGRVIRLYEEYVKGSRDDRFRVSGLKLLGYHAGQNQRYAIATEAYATLLDEYGQNALDADGEPVPVPPSQRLRPYGHGWNGVRMPVPTGLDLGEVRYGLGLLYWQMEDWSRCVRTLGPLIEDAKFRKNESRARALYMAGRSRYRMYDYPGGVKPIRRLIREHPNFEAVQEAYVYAARGYAEMKDWREIEYLYKDFIRKWRDANWRPRMDLYACLAEAGQGRPAEGIAKLKGITESETFEDVKADACYHLAMHYAATTPPDYRQALKYFDKSIALYPRQASCLAAAKVYMKRQKWEKARTLLRRVTHDFPRGDARKTSQAKDLLTVVLKRIAKSE